MRAGLAAVGIIVAALFVGGCAQSTSPTMPSSALTVPSSSTGTPKASTGTPKAASVTIVDDDLLNGNAFTLTSFDGASVLAGINSQGSFTAPYDSNTVFRKAQLDKYQPSDPCRTAAAAYNLANGSSDTTLNAALSTLVSSGCNARVLLDTGSNVVPPDPIKSFRPIP